MNEEIEKALGILNNNGIIVYPTDTIWGIGCDATSEAAINNLYKVKERDLNKSFIILIDDDRKLNKYIKEIPEVAWDLLDSTIKPLTVIYPGAINLPKNLIANDGSIAIRVVKEGSVYELVKAFKKPIVSTSANLSGETTPKNKKDISSNILERVNHIVNLHLESNETSPSSIIKLQIDGQIEIIRK